MQRACGQVKRTFTANKPPPLPAGTQSYRAHGVSFAYPAVLHEGTLTDHVGNGPQLWAASFALDTEDWIGIGADQLSAPVTAARLAAFTPAADKAARHFFGQAGGVMQAGPQQITVGGLPALQFRGATTTTQGIALNITLIFAFDGTTQYFLYCAHTRAGAGQMERACGQVTGSFHITGAAPRAAAPGTSPPSPGATSTTTPSAASTTPGSSPASGTLGAKVVPAPSGFTLFQSPDVHNGPMSAADFNKYWGDAAFSHFVRGYDVTYDSNDGPDLIEVTLFQFATPAGAAIFTAGWGTAEPGNSKADPVIPGADDYDSTSPDHGIYDHGVIATKGNLAFVVDDITGSAAPVPLVETMARQQYAAL